MALVATPRGLRYRLEALAAADRRYDQMERRMGRVAAFLDKRFGRLVTESDLNQLGFARVVLTIVGAQSALAFVNFCHCLSLSIEVAN
jgi:hypothetical protein